MVRGHLACTVYVVSNEAHLAEPLQEAGQHTHTQRRLQWQWKQGSSSVVTCNAISVLLRSMSWLVTSLHMTGGALHHVHPKQWLHAGTANRLKNDPLRAGSQPVTCFAALP